MTTPFGNAVAYEGYVGRWSRLVGQQFIDWLAVAPGSTWLDMGAGTGVLTTLILQKTSPTKVVAIDLSPAYLDFARQHIQDKRVEFRIGDASELASELPPFDVAVAGLVLNFVPSPEQATRNMAQAINDGGMVAAYVWDYGGRMEMMRQFWDAAAVVDPSARDMDAGKRFAICEPDNLRALFQSVGLSSVEVTAIDFETRFQDLDDFWLPFLGAQGSVSKYLRDMSEEMRTAVRDQLQRQLPINADGSIALNARAWAVKGIKS